MAETPLLSLDKDQRRTVIDSSSEEDEPREQVKLSEKKPDTKRSDAFDGIPDDIADILKEAEVEQSLEKQPDEEKEISKKERSRTSKSKKKKKKKKSEEEAQFFDFNDSEHEFDIYGYKKNLQNQKNEMGHKFNTGAGGTYIYDKSEGTASPIPAQSKPASDWGVYKVDAQARLYNCHVYEDFSVTLNQTDVGYGELGHNKFYIMQLLEANGCNKWYTYFKWGRVGAKKPQDSLIKYASLVQALRAFQKQFKKKTLNEWGKRRTHFKAQPGKYRIVQVEADQIEVAKRNEKRQRLAVLLEQSAARYKMHVEPALAKILYKMFDQAQMERALKEHNIDLKKCPLGMLSKDQILEGYSILKKILKLLVEGQRMGLKSNLSAILPLSNDFYSIIPHDFGMKRPPPISLYAHVKQKIDLLDILMDIHLANASILNELQILETCHPADFYYKILNSEIRALAPQTHEYEAIVRAIESTAVHQYSIQVEQIFSVFRLPEALRFIPFHCVEKKMLWHGSRDSNLVGILTEGLRVAPEEAPKTGYMFGKGIYFSDVASKAANYCRTGMNETGLLLLCEVGVGSEYKLNKSEFLARPPEGYLSVKGVGNNAPTEKSSFKNEDQFLVDTVMNGLKEEGKSEQECEVAWNMLKDQFKFGENTAALYEGEVQENPEIKSEFEGFKSELKYNEYVIYEEAQAKIRYIIHWRKISK